LAAPGCVVRTRLERETTAASRGARSQPGGDSGYRAGVAVTARELTLEQAIEDFDAGAYQAFEHEAEEQRAETLRRYPRAHWPDMTLEEYAQGQDGQPENLCRWIERQTDQMGSIRGGSARKLIVYKHRSEPGWYFPPEFGDEQAAWTRVRAAFIEAFALADQGRWDEIDEIDPLTRGAALLTKVLWVYFPDELLPITSSENLRHFLRIAGRGDIASDQSIRTVRLNRALLSALRQDPRLADVSTKALERLLYTRFSPLEGRLVKIAPGEDASLWSDCETNGYICVGWDDVGDLRQYESKDAFVAAFQQAFDYSTEAKAKEKADEVWLLLDLGVGDRVVANKGTKRVLAVGTVASPGYQWNADRETHKHTVRVDWDESYAKEIAPQPYWAFKTVLPLSSKVRDLVLGEVQPDDAADDEPAPPASDEEPLFKRIAGALTRKNQAILYGPPGTGKTWHASAFARWWLRSRNATAPASRPPAGASAGAGGTRTWLVTTKPSEWGWDELFDKGEEQFRRGRLDRHYDAISPGDLVIGYTASPDKRVDVLARVARISDTNGGPTFVLAPLRRVTDGPTWDELNADEFLKASEPVRNRMQGTLFQLAADEAERLMALIAERDPDAVAATSSVVTSAANGQPDPLGDALEWVTFHPSYSYEDFIEGFRPARTDGGATLSLEDGIFKTMCARALANRERTYLLVIDEINRANVTKVLGELITLIEKDKRERSTQGRYAVRLPYSKERLVIPPNLFILGTMNTADRSIKMLDTALRRRFGFVELMPDPGLLASEVGGLRLDDLLEALNTRVAKEAGREKQIGHSFFLRDGQPISDEAEFAEIFRDEIVPLLQEYAVDDYDELAGYLGPRVVDRDALTLDNEVLSDSSRLLEALEEHLLGPQADA
jgi:5-methylcytosine-specific restriction protein B